MSWLTPELFFGTILGTMIIIVGAQVTFILMLIKSQREYTDAKVDPINKAIEKLTPTYIGEMSRASAKNIRISIIQPKDWKNRDPKRIRGKEYKISVPVRGVISGHVGSGYLAYHVSPSGDYRVIEKLSISDDGAWSATAKIPGHDNNSDYEVVAIAHPSEIDLTPTERMFITEDMVMSNRIPVKLAYEDAPKTLK